MLLNMPEDKRGDKNHSLGKQSEKTTFFKQLTPTHPGDPHEHWVGPEGGAEADFWVRTTGVFSQTWGRRDEPRASLDSRWSLGFPVHGDSWR